MGELGIDVGFVRRWEWSDHLRRGSILGSESRSATRSVRSRITVPPMCKVIRAVAGVMLVACWAVVIPPSGKAGGSPSRSSTCTTDAMIAMRGVAATNKMLRRRIVSVKPRRVGAMACLFVPGGVCAV